MIASHFSHVHFNRKCQQMKGITAPQPPPSPFNHPPGLSSMYLYWSIGMEMEQLSFGHLCHQTIEFYSVRNDFSGIQNFIQSMQSFSSHFSLPSRTNRAARPLRLSHSRQLLLLILLSTKARLRHPKPKRKTCKRSNLIEMESFPTYKEKNKTPVSNSDRFYSITIPGAQSIQCILKYHTYCTD